MSTSGFVFGEVRNAGRYFLLICSAFTKKMIEVRPIQIEDLRALAKSLQAFRKHMGRDVLRGAVWPSRIVAQVLPDSEEQAPWLGVWGTFNGAIAGSGGWNAPLVDGTLEIGYEVAPPAQGQGVATAMAKELVKMSFDRGAKVVIAHTWPDGIASQRVLIKAGFFSEGLVLVPKFGVSERFKITRPE